MSLPRVRCGVAVIADAHFHDMTADFGAPGVLVQGRRLMLRSWPDTAFAARAVNESAAALTAALTRIHAEGVRHVVLLGDYSDDGQSVTVTRLAALLRQFRDRLGLQFYAIPGNHDVFGTHGKHTATRYLCEDGETRLVTSDPVLAARQQGAQLAPAVYCNGQPAGLMPLAEFGLFRQPQYLHWECPFGGADPAHARTYAATAADGSVTHRLMDASYLVEPEPGLWLLLLDTNVFEPRPGIADSARKRAFLDPSDAGWNALLRVKPFLLPWVADVTARARRLGKTLLTFSHYPALDPFEDADGAETAMFGASVAARRTPGPAVAQALAGAGVRLLLSGHIHANGASVVQTANGPLTQIAVPALSGYPAAFKLLTPQADHVAVTTLTLDDLPLPPLLATLYAAQGGQPEPSFGPFLRARFRARVLAHDLARDWPPEIATATTGATAADLLRLLQPGAHPAAITPPRCDAAPGAGGTLADLAQYPLPDLIADWYCLRVAGLLALAVLPPDRLRQMQALASLGDPASRFAARVQPEQRFYARFLSVLAVSLARMARDDRAAPLG